LSELWHSIRKPDYLVGNRIQQLQQQIEVWQALLEKLAGNE
jgi:hypothetical protein